MKNWQTKAINFFLKHTNVQQSDIVEMTQIHNGYVNVSFLFVLKDGTKYQVRLTTGIEIVNRLAEYEVLNLISNNDFVYYDKKTGNAIKKWIEGFHPNKKQVVKRKFIKNLVSEINKLHLLPIEKTNIPKVDYALYNKHINKLSNDVKEKYLYLLNKYKDLELVINHSDINSQNLLIDKKFNVHLIDWEWVTLNNDYWDYANFIREEYIPIKKIKLFTKCNKNLNLEILYDHVFICCTFALLWTYVMPKTEKIEQYNIKLTKQVNDYYKRFYC